MVELLILPAGYCSLTLMLNATSLTWQAILPLTYLIMQDSGYNSPRYPVEIDVNAAV